MAASEVFLHAEAGPCGERIDLDAARPIRFEDRQRRSIRAVVALAARQPGIKNAEGACQRFDLSYTAARIRVADPNHSLRINCRRFPGIRPESPTFGNPTHDTEPVTET